MKRQSIFGIGDKAGLPTVIFLAAAYWLTNVYREIFSFQNILEPYRVNLGLALIGIGFIVLILSAGHLVYSYLNKKLAKTGFYRLAANPLYANAVIFLIPGAALFLDSWLMLFGSFILYYIYRKYIHVESDYLKEAFGKEYEEYYKTIVFKWL